MKIIVTKNFVDFKNDINVNKNEYNVTELEFEFSKEYEGLTCKAIFNKIDDDQYYQRAILDNKCEIPSEVLNGVGIIIGVYAYEVKNDELIKRYSPSPKKLILLEGSYYEGASTPEEITPSQFEEYTAYLDEQIANLDKIQITSNKIINGVRINITNSDGITESTDIYNGEKGDKGDKGETGATGAPGRDGYVQYTFDNTPTQNSLNPVTSGGIYTYINNILGDINTILATLVTVEESE